MIYMLLKPFVKSSVLANFFSYISVRTSISIFTSLIIWIFFGDYFIKCLKQHQKNGCTIRDLGQPTRNTKANTPTCGGVFIIFTMLLNVLLWCDLENNYIFLLVCTTIFYGILGFLDDYLKIAKKNYKGINFYQKLITQSLFSVIISWYLISLQGLELASSINFPFLKNVFINIGWLFPVFVFFVVVGTSNAVNITDGLDGLAIGSVLIVTCSISILSYFSGHSIFAKYLYISYIPGAGELVVFCGALCGSCMGFLWHNIHPAKLFMGDTGSLFIGAILGVISLIIKQEILFAIMSGIFVWESLSVIIQVLYYKRTKKRIFLIAPFHHHLEKKGWSETQIVIRLWIISVLLSIISLASMKIK